MSDLVTRPEVLTGAGPDLQPAAFIVAELGGPQLLPGELAAQHHQLPCRLELHQGEQTALAFLLLLQHQFGQPLGYIYHVLVVLLNLVL